MRERIDGRHGLNGLTQRPCGCCRRVVRTASHRTAIQLLAVGELVVVLIVEAVDVPSPSVSLSSESETS